MCAMPGYFTGPDKLHLSSVQQETCPILEIRKVSSELDLGLLAVVNAGSQEGHRDSHRTGGCSLLQTRQASRRPSSPPRHSAPFHLILHGLTTGLLMLTGNVGWNLFSHHSNSLTTGEPCACPQTHHAALPLTAPVSGLNSSI